MDYFYAYLFTRLDAFFVIITLIFIISFVISIVGIIFSLVLNINDEHDEFEKVKRLTKPFFIALAISVLINLIVPTKKELAFIYIAPKMANNIELKEAANRLPNIINFGLKYIEEQLNGEREANNESK